MEKIIGHYCSCQSETYADCARITLHNKSKDGAYCVKILDGILYLYRGGYLIRVASTFDLTIL